MEKKSNFIVFRKISLNKRLILPALNGEKTIYKASKKAKYFLNSDFTKHGFNKPDVETHETEFEVYEFTEDLNLEEMFSCFPDFLVDLILTENQIIDFCQTYPEQLSLNWDNFFLIRKEKKIYVVDVILAEENRLEFYLYSFEDKHVWKKEFKRHLIVPKKNKNK